MFSVAEKRHIAEVVERTIRELNHPEVDNDNITFHLHVNGRESWSWADIHQNSLPVESAPNQWNEHAREVLGNG